MGRAVGPGPFTASASGRSYRAHIALMLLVEPGSYKVSIGLILYFSPDVDCGGGVIVPCPFTDPASGRSTGPVLPSFYGILFVRFLFYILPSIFSFLSLSFFLPFILPFKHTILSVFWSSCLFLFVQCFFYITSSMYFISLILRFVSFSWFFFASSFFHAASVFITFFSLSAFLFFLSVFSFSLFCISILNVLVF